MLCWVIFAGKIDMMDGDPNEFAGGRGDTQFLNYSMMYAAPTAIVPASTLGAGVMYMPNQHVTFVSQLVSATDSTFASFDNAFDDWSDGQIWVNALMTQYRVSDLPGGFNVSKDLADGGILPTPNGAEKMAGVFADVVNQLLSDRAD